MSADPAVTPADRPLDQSGRVSVVDIARGRHGAARRTRAIVPQAAAAALGAILDRLAAYHRELEKVGVKREDIVETCARIVLQTVRGSGYRFSAAMT